MILNTTTKYFILFLLGLIFSTKSYSFTCNDLNGAYVESPGLFPEYLGFFGTQFTFDSIQNPNSAFGSSLGHNSLRNTSSSYGSSWGINSAFNTWTTTPPQIYKYGALIGYLTVNGSIANRVSLQSIDESCSFTATSPYRSLSQVTNITASPQESSLTLEWNSVIGATSYQVSRCLNSSCTDPHLLGTVTTPGALISGLEPDTLYIYAIFGVRDGIGLPSIGPPGIKAVRTLAIESPQIDITPPTISLVGESTVYINQNASFVDPGVNAIDDVDGNLESSVTGNVDVTTIGEYILTYTTTDSSGNTASIQRTVIVQAFCVNDHPELDSSVPSVNVTFRVDMSSVVTNTDGVYIAGGGGTFDQCGYLMTDDGNDVWSVTRALEPNKQYRYLFRNQPSYDTWEGFEVSPGSSPPGACFVGEWTERIVYVWDSDIILDVVPYAGCNDPPYDWALPPNPRDPLVEWDYQISSGSNHNCALEDSGVVCWGWNYSGQTLTPALSNPTQISSGYMHNCAIDDTGVVCWGWDGHGQIHPPVLNEPKQVSVGDSHSCALDNSGVICWGSNNDGQINVPNLTNPTQLSVGLHHSCAIDDNGAHCWGQNSWGESNVPELTNPTHISGGSDHTCAIDDTGVVCWGRNNLGQIDVPALSNPTIVEAGDWQTCAIDDTGVVCWGDNGAGQSNVPSLTNPTDISSGYMHSCALDDAGVHCWGKNDHSQLYVPELMIDPDGDGYSNQNGVDVFPFDSSEWLDTDSDGVGDNSDAFPSDSTETLDTDLDGRGNNADQDDDNDGVIDEFDLDPLDPNKGVIPTQIVSVKGNPVGLIGQNVSIDVEYDVNDGDSSLTGLGLRVHFDSRVLSITSLTNVLSESNLYTESIPKDDSNDLDNDIITDMYLEIGWAAIFGDWPGVIPTELVTLNFDVTQQAPESTRLNFSSGSNSAGYSFEGISYDLDIVNATWDFDSNGKADALTDGLLLLRYTFGLRDDALLANAIAHDSPLSPEQVQENVSASVSSIADIDNSSNVDALTDGLLLLRYLFGLTGDSLINSSVAINAERTTATEIEDYIQSLMP